MSSKINDLASGSLSQHWLTQRLICSFSSGTNATSVFFSHLVMDFAPKKSQNGSVVAKLFTKINWFKKFTPLLRAAFYGEHLMDLSEVPG